MKNKKSNERIIAKVGLIINFVYIPVLAAMFFVMLHEGYFLVLAISTMFPVSIFSVILNASGIVFRFTNREESKMKYHVCIIINTIINLAVPVIMYFLAIFSQTY